MGLLTGTGLQRFKHRERHVDRHQKLGKHSPSHDQLLSTDILLMWYLFKLLLKN